MMIYLGLSSLITNTVYFNSSSFKYSIKKYGALSIYGSEIPILDTVYH